MFRSQKYKRRKWIFSFLYFFSLYQGRPYNQIIYIVLASQIRVHLAEIGYPIVGDYVYSNGKNPFNVEGQMLHAKQIEFVNPRTGEDMKIEAPIPKYFQDIINICDAKTI